MTTELTKAAQQALEQLEFLNACYPHKTAADAIAALQAALTQRPAAQTERDILNDSAWIAVAKFGWNCGVEGTRDLLNQCIEQRIKDRVEARASLPAPQQATPEPVGEPVYMTASAFVDGQPYTWREVSKALYDSQPEKWRRILYARPAPGVPEAWDEGYKQGVEDERTSEANIGVAGFGAKVAPARQNPYRAAAQAKQ